MITIHKNAINLFSLGLLLVTWACTGKKEVTVERSATSKESNTVELTEAQFKLADIRFTKITQRNVSGVLKVNGKLDVPPQNLISISAPFGGFLRATDMLQGKPVYKGEQIAIIQNPEYVQLQQDYLDNKSQLEFLEAEYDRQKALAQENINAQKSLQQAKALYFSKLAMVNGLHSKLKILNIDFVSLEKGAISNVINLYSPINGFITEVNFNIGSFLSPTDILFKIVDTHHLHAELTVFEKDITKIKKGQKVRFTLPGAATERIATVYLIGREILPDRTVRIHCHLEEEETNLLPGMYMSAIIELGSNAVNVLPEEAIVDFEGRHYIFISAGDRGHRFKAVEVRTGLQEDGYAEVIIDNTIQGDLYQVVDKGAYSLLSKMKNSEEE